MRRKILFAILSIFVILVLVLPGCGCYENTGNSPGASVDTDQNNRLSALESTVGQLANRPTGLTSDDLAGYALKSEIPSAPDMSGYVTRAEYDAMVANYDAIIVSLEDRLAILESEGSEGGSTSGEVTVVIDTETQPYVFTSATTAATYVFPVRITNGTDDYQKVTFGIVLRCISNDNKADVFGFSYSLNLVGAVFTPTEVSSPVDCQLIYFIWTSGEGIPIAPGKEVSYYLNLSGFGTNTYTELWEVTLTNIIAVEL